MGFKAGCLVAVLLGATPAISVAADEAQARLRLEQARQAYDLAQFEQALTEYSEAYRLDPRPPFLFNIAQCHRQLGNYERAAFFYRRYLDLSPKRPANADVVKVLIQEVEARKAEELRQRRLQAEAELARPKLEPGAFVQPAAAPQVKPPEATSSSLLSKWWFWAGLGVVTAAAGTTAYLATRPQATTLEPIHVR